MMEQKLVFNWTAKENAIRQLEFEKQDKESIVKAKEVFDELGIEVLNG